METLGKRVRAHCWPRDKCLQSADTPAHDVRCGGICFFRLAPQPTGLDAPSGQVTLEVRWIYDPSTPLSGRAIFLFFQCAANFDLLLNLSFGISLTAGMSGAAVRTRALLSRGVSRVRSMRCWAASAIGSTPALPARTWAREDRPDLL